MGKRLTEIEKKYKRLISLENLTLAWDRINASTNNLSYKNFYRTLFWYYDYDLEANLTLLSKRLENKSYKPSKSFKIYKPKESGLQRPFTFLDIDDLIVYQAIANIVIPAFSKKRRSLENRYVFSNIFNNEPESNIFLFENWKKGYRNYKRKISANYLSGFTFTAHFDLAAYYDTIDQNSLLSNIFQDTHNIIGSLLFSCLQEWNNKTESDSRKISHGIPQGPLSSSIFGELFLLSIDEFLVKNNINYSRYVDDIVIQGKSIEEVQRAIILLDIKCKEKGLVPQSSKFRIYEATSVEDAIGKNPSLSTVEKQDIFSDEKKVLEIFNKSFEKDTFDSSLIRYVLKVFKDSDILIDKIFEEFSNHYEFVEEFCLYLANVLNSSTSSKILLFITSYINRIIPYDYVESEIWILLSKLSPYENIKQFAKIAIMKLQKQPSDILKEGIYTYLSKLNDNRYIGFLSHEDNKLVLAFQIKNVTNQITNNSNFPELLKHYSNRKSDTIKALMARHLYFMFQYNELSIIQYKKFLKLLPQLNNQTFETINYYLREDFAINSDINWKTILGSSFEHATTIFYHAHLAGKRHKSEWLNAIDSFNDLLIRAFITNIKIWNASLKTPPLIVKDKKGKDKAELYGSLVDKGKPLATAFPLLITNASDIHSRRCKNPLSHAMDEKTFIFTSFVTRSEYYEYLAKEKIVLSEIIKIINSYIC